jgi:hypothetical protein
MESTKTKDMLRPRGAGSSIPLTSLIYEQKVRENEERTRNRWGKWRGNLSEVSLPNFLSGINARGTVAAAMSNNRSMDKTVPNLLQLIDATYIAGHSSPTFCEPATHGPR